MRRLCYACPCVVFHYIPVVPNYYSEGICVYIYMPAHCLSCEKSVFGLDTTLIIMQLFPIRDVGSLGTAWAVKNPHLCGTTLKNPYFAAKYLSGREAGKEDYGNCDKSYNTPRLISLPHVRRNRLFLARLRVLLFIYSVL